MRIPIVSRVYEVLTRPAPLTEFDEYDDYWDSRDKDGRTVKVLDRYITIAASIPENAKVLDIGCGDGSFLSYLKRKRPDCKTVGLDLSATAVEMTLAKGCKALRLEAETPLLKQVGQDWDVVVMMEIIEHIPNAEKLVREVVELKPKAVFITIPNVGYILHRMRLALTGRFPVTCIFYHMREHLRFWTVKDFVEWAPSVNLNVDSYHAQCDETGRLVSFFVRTFPALLSNRLVYRLSPR